MRATGRLLPHVPAQPRHSQQRLSQLRDPHRRRNQNDDRHQHREREGPGLLGTSIHHDEERGGYDAQHQQQGVAHAIDLHRPAEHAHFMLQFFYPELRIRFLFPAQLTNRPEPPPDEEQHAAARDQEDVRAVEPSLVEHEDGCQGAGDSPKRQ